MREKKSMYIAVAKDPTLNTEDTSPIYRLEGHTSQEKSKRAHM
jgi:hypothetical protein